MPDTHIYRQDALLAGGAPGAPPRDEGSPTAAGVMRAAGGGRWALTHAPSEAVGGEVIYEAEQPLGNHDFPLHPVRECFSSCDSSQAPMAWH